MKRIYVPLIFVLLLSGCNKKQPNNLVLPTQQTQFVIEETDYSAMSTEDLFATEESMTLADETSAETTVFETSTTVYYTRFPERDRWAALGTKEDPTQSMEDYTYEETTSYEIGNLETTVAQTVQQTTYQYTEPETTIANTQPAQTVESWENGNFDDLNSVELPSFYRTRGSVAYVDKTVVPDSNIFEKDAYGNYIIPMLFLRNAPDYKKALPYNEYGKIPYCYAYDSHGNVLNPLPKEYEEFRSMFMIGQSQDYNNRPINYTQPAFE